MIINKEEAEIIADKYLDQRWEEFKQLDFYKASWAEHGEPTIKDLSKDLDRIIKATDTLDPRAKVGTLIKWFHKSAEKASRRESMSPYDYFEALKKDKVLFRKFFINRITRSDWYNEKHGENKHYVYEGYVPSFIYIIGLTTSMSATRVSLFKPTVAKSLIKKYLNEYNTIFDPFSGYSGRMLGTLSLGKVYIGSDINDITVKESNDILNFVKKDSHLNVKLAANKSKVIVADAFNNKGEYECLLTCPPYSDSKNKQIEIWQNSKGEKIECPLTCDEIIEKCLDNYKCKKYVFVVDETSSKYDKYVEDYITNNGYINANTPNANIINKNLEKIVVIKR